MSNFSLRRAALAPCFAFMGLTFVAGCASTPCPAVEPAAPREVPAPAPAADPPSDPAPAELVGEFALLTGTTKEKTVDFSAFAKSSGAGEFMIGFTKEGVALSAWRLSHAVSDKDPSHIVYALCRGRVVFQPEWRGKTMIFPSKIEVKGFSDALDQQARREDNATTTTRITSSSGCSFSLDAGEYTVEVVASDPQGPTKLRMGNAESSFDLARSAPVEELDVRAVVEGLKGK